MTSKRQSAQSRSRTNVALVSLGSEVVRCGLRTMLRELGTLDDVLDSADFDQSMELLHAGRASLLVLSDSDHDKAEKLARTAADLGVRVLVVLPATCDQTLARAATLHGDGYLLENALTRDALMSAMSDLDSGLVPMPGPVARKLMARVRPTEPEQQPEQEQPPAQDSERLSAPLTCRELEALTLLAEGLSNKQIARRLGISEHGAKRHVANILAKLNVSNRTLATVVAINRGLVRDPGTRRAR